MQHRPSRCEVTGLVETLLSCRAGGEGVEAVAEVFGVVAASAGGGDADRAEFGEEAR